MPKLNYKFGVSISLLVAISLFVVACDDQVSVSDILRPETGRWYSEQQVLLGKSVYDANCISCHNPNARGTFKWKQPLEDGSYPPPPLNGSAHAWHHPLSVLLKTINDGGIQMGGKMPPFRDVLKDNEKVAVIAYFQSYWNDDIYSRWLQRNQPQ